MGVKRLPHSLYKGCYCKQNGFKTIKLPQQTTHIVMEGVEVKSHLQKGYEEEQMCGGGNGGGTPTLFFSNSFGPRNCCGFGAYAPDNMQQRWLWMPTWLQGKERLWYCRVRDETKTGSQRRTYCEHLFIYINRKVFVCPAIVPTSADLQRLIHCSQCLEVQDSSAESSHQCGACKM
jgi:hypothetical protein